VVQERARPKAQDAVWVNGARRYLHDRLSSQSPQGSDQVIERCLERLLGVREAFGLNGRHLPAQLDREQLQA
jgi:hypothetical protein